MIILILCDSNFNNEGGRKTLLFSLAHQLMQNSDGVPTVTTQTLATLLYMQKLLADSKPS